MRTGGGGAAREQDVSSFGSRLRTLRVAASLSQEELARRAGLTTHAVSALERGVRTRPYPHTVRALAEALGLDEGQRAALADLVPDRRQAEPAEPVRHTGTTARSELPSPLTPLVARARELARVQGLLLAPETRLVTLTGTGGVGKTRLAVAAARRTAEAFGGDVVYVELAPLVDAALVLPAIADRLATGLSDDADPVAVVAEAVADRTVLLVLDNVEHVLAAAPRLATLLEACPGLTVLATSRSPLRVRGEQVVVVPPLALPDASAARIAEVADSEAGDLFLARAHDAAPDAVLTDAHAQAVSEICIRLAGIPLALELAAARLRTLDPPTLLDRLDRAMAADGHRDLPARQRTMRAALDWSYRLLRSDEQALLRLLSVFSGGFTLHDVEEVAARSALIPPERVLPLLDALAGQSLLVRHPSAHARHLLLEPVAQYAAGHLDAAVERERAVTAHTAWFLDLAEEAAPHYERETQVAWLARVDDAHANLTVAVERALAAGDPDTAGRIGWALWLYWWLRGHHQHGRRLVEGVLEHDLSEPVRTRVRIAAATMAFAQDDVEAARAWWSSALPGAVATGDVLAQTNCVAGRGLAELATGDVAGARRSFTAALELASAAGSAGEWIAALTRIWLGTVELLDGDTATAERQVRAGLASAERRGDRLTGYVALFNLSQLASAGGDLPAARRHLEDGLRLSRETRDLANLAHFLDALAVIDGLEAEHRRVPVLRGAAEGLRASISARGYGYYRPDEAQAARTEDAARSALGDPAYDALWREAYRFGPDEAVSRALGAG